MTILQLRYIIATIETGSITEAAKRLHVSQPSLSSAIKDVEAEIGEEIFIRSRSGVQLTKRGKEFAGYARAVITQMQLLENRFVNEKQGQIVFGVSTQHYTFAENAFVELTKKFEGGKYDFYFNETGTHRILEDVSNRLSNIGVIYLSDENEDSLRKVMDEYDLAFTQLFEAKLHLLVRREHPLAQETKVSLEDLKEYPRINFVQGSYEAPYYAEEMFSTLPSDKEIRINDRGAIVRLLLGSDAYTISSGIFPRYLHGSEIISVPLDSERTMRIGYVIVRGHVLSELEQMYIDEIMKYAPESAG
ncbi:MAG: LysR family transcriptional regulator [Eubacterium sp.]|nr:LysR family transcriptional regulator [Eubacterium sp.]